MFHFAKHVRGIVSLLLGAAILAQAAEPGDVIINEVYFAPKDSWVTQSEAVELLVLKDNVDLNGMILSDRDIWNKPSEDQTFIQDLGRGFLSSLKAGTLIVVCRGPGEDDIDPSDFVLRFYARTSVYCNNSPSTNAFSFHDAGDNLHFIQGGKQLDFVKYRGGDQPAARAASHPGSLEWEKGVAGAIDTGRRAEAAGIQFLGDKPDLNNYLAAWRVYSETAAVTNNLGLPNGGRNTAWIESLRKGTQTPKARPR